MVGLIVGITGPAIGQVLPSQLEHPHNHLPWFTVEGEHFMIHYQAGNSRSALLALSIAEEVYTPITEFYRFEPNRKTNIVLRDREDYSNGAAYFFDNKIEIWVPSIDTPFRGTTHWFKNVIAHEFIHMVQLGASMKRSSRIPAIYFQWIGYEDVRRPDVLYGFPNSMITFPFATVSIPAWFAEGIAQYQISGLTHDQWDNHRDMLLRTRILAGRALSLDEMNHFNSKNSLERELVYNQGFDFVRYLADRFGDDVLADLTHESASGGKSNFDHVLKSVTGIDAAILYINWLENRNKYYAEQTVQLSEEKTEYLTDIGFLNFYPQFDPTSGNLAYLSNKERDHSRTSLIIHQQGKDDLVIDEQAFETTFNDLHQTCHLNANTVHGVSLNHVSNRFSFSPDGSKIAYTRPKLNRYGEIYRDLLIYNIPDDSRSRITSSSRIQDPDWHPFSDSVAAVQINDGTQNLVLIDLNSSEIYPLTSFQNGETIYTPIWSKDGDAIYFSISTGGKRDIARLDLESKKTVLILHSPDIDFRDPFIDPVGQSLFFASDVDGIFNIYSLDLISSKIYRYTNTAGGAFMPHVSDETLLYSQFRWDGYKIAQLKDYRRHKRTLSTVYWSEYAQHPPESKTDATKAESFTSASDFLSINETEASDAITFELDGNKKIWRPYSETSTGLTLYPVIRFDQYSKMRGRNSRLLTGGEFGRLGENMWRDLKIGAYFSLRDVTERLSIFGSALFGPGSIHADNITHFISPARLNQIDRDLYFSVDYRGLPFIKRSWSPTVTIEIFNIKRNVRDGLFIEEFPCTSCLPTERALDIRYSMWEANLYFRSKLNRWSLIELGASYSPYTVTIDRFFSQEFQQLIPSTSSVYFKGSRYSASYIADLTIPDRHADIAPRGLRSSIGYRFEPGRLLQEFEVENGILSPSYSRDQNHSIELNNRFGFTLFGENRAMLTSRFFTYLNRPDDYFYLDYTGGLAGMRSYPYFAIGGQQTFFSRASLLFPLVTNMNRQLRSASFDKMFAHLFFEIGNGWGGPLDIGSGLKTGFGSELRVAFNNYYFFPMKFFINTTYGLNRFDLTLPPQFITPDGSSEMSYGRELLFYVGLTFDFDF